MAIATPFSANPLLCGYLRLENTNLMLLSSANLSQISDPNGTLSLRISVGYPYLLKILVSALTTDLAVLSVSNSEHKNPEYASMSAI